MKTNFTQKPVMDGSFSRKKSKGQSFVEFALIIPVLLIVLLGVVELTLYIGSYINLVDLTREAARFASNRDPFSPTSNGDLNCSTPDSFNFFYDTSCVFSPLAGNPNCTASTFCNGFNSTLGFKSDEDDILISVFTETGVNQSGTIVPTITHQWPGDNLPWVWSNNDTDVSHNDNWRRNCDRQSLPAAANPQFTRASMQSFLNGTAMPNKGFVVVEVYYCYEQILNIPFLSVFLPNPILMHTYSIMPLPSAQPTATPRP
jgi:hypothetical protein